MRMENNAACVNIEAETEAVIEANKKAEIERQM